MENNAMKQNKKISFFKRRSFKYGSLSTVFIALFLAGVVIVNIILTAVTDSYPLKLDLTTKQNYKLSAQTINYVKNLKDKIEITILATKNEYTSDSNLNTSLQIMEQYPQYNHNITLRFLDPDKNPGFVSNYSSESIERGDILITGTDRHKLLTTSDLVVTSQDSSGNTTVTGNQTESSVSSALSYITTKDLPTVVFTKGHNEQDSSALQSLMQKNNYEISTQDLSTETINSAAKTIAIVAPKADFSTDEINKLDAFLSNGQKFGRNLIVFFDTDQPSLPNLENYVKEWGVQVEKGVIYDSNGYGTFIPVAATVNSDIVGTVSTDIGTALAYSRPLTLLFSEKDIRSTQQVLATPDTSCWYPKTLTSSFKASSSDKKGPFTTMALATKKRYEGDSTYTGNMLVSGSYKMIDEQLLSMPNLNNANVVIGAINHIAGLKSSLTITSKSAETTTMTLTTPVKNLFLVIFVILIPLCVFVFGIITFVRRRHL